MYTELIDMMHHCTDLCVFCAGKTEEPEEEEPIEFPDLARFCD